jgi:hypothetical protein
MVPVFSGQQERPTAVASDPQRGVGQDQTPLRVLATTTRSKRRTSVDVRRPAAICTTPPGRANAAEPHKRTVQKHIENNSKSLVYTRITGGMSRSSGQLDGCSTTPHMEGTIMKAKRTKKTLKAAAAALGVAAVLALPGCATVGGAGGSGLIGGAGGGGTTVGGIVGSLGL